MAAFGGLAAAMRGGFGNPHYKQTSKGPVGLRPARNPLMKVGPWGHVSYPSWMHPARTGSSASKPAGGGGAGANGSAPSTGAAPSAGAPATPASSLDSTYFQNVAENQFKTNNQINALNLRQSNAQTGLQAQLAQMQHQQPLDQLHLEQQANARGALYSTPYGQQLGQLNYGYLGRQGAAQNNYGQLVASIASQIAGLHGAENLYEAGQAEAAAERASSAAQKNPAIGESAASLAPVAPRAARAGRGFGRAAKRMASNSARNKGRVG